MAEIRRDDVMGPREDYHDDEQRDRESDKIRDRVVVIEQKHSGLREQYNEFSKGSTADRQQLHRDVGNLRELVMKEISAVEARAQDKISELKKAIERLPNWAVAAFTLMGTAIGSMAMWIITHAR
jgi:hypothetical protein